MLKKKIIGIDLGTTNTVVAFLENLTPTVIPNVDGFNLTPSLVTYNLNGEIVVGIQSKRQRMINSLDTFSSVKRFIGRKYDEIIKELNNIPYLITKDKYNNIKLLSSDKKKEFSPEEISSLILKKVIFDTNIYLNSDIKNAVITVPAYFNDSQRVATKDAATIAGITVDRIINEPTAAALAYGFSKKIDNKIILIFDFGGGTLDISILEMGNEIIEVLATSGDTYLGGDDIDNILVKYIITEFEKVEGINLYNDKQALQRIIEASEKAKIDLSFSENTTIDIPYISIKNNIPLHIKKNLTRNKLEELIFNLVEKTKKPLFEAINDSKLTLEKIDEIVLVGGSTKIPLVKKMLTNIFKKPLISDINPDEVVALGAAVQASILAGDVTDIILIDITPLSLGVALEDDTMSIIVKKNTRIPLNFYDTFSTSTDYQDSVLINILQGERVNANDNTSLGTFILQGIPKLKAGIPKIIVSFKIDSNGILCVTATEETTGVNQSIIIENSSNLDNNKIKEIILDSENNLFNDEINKKLINFLNLFDKNLSFLELMILKNKNILFNLYLKYLINQIKYSYKTNNLKLIFNYFVDFYFNYKKFIINKFKY
jgi:molecular chaperone DnaK